MKLRKLLVACACAVLLAGSLTVGASAAETEKPAAPVISTAAVKPGGTAEPQADVIETKYRYTSSGLVQYRRWNATHGYWVDPDWITLPGIKP